MGTPTIKDFARDFLLAKGWSAKNQICCKVAKIYHREGLETFASLLGWKVEDLEKAYALRATMQAKNRRRRGQKSIKRVRSWEIPGKDIEKQFEYQKKGW